jgi:hypothetical protein
MLATGKRPRPPPPAEKPPVKENIVKIPPKPRIVFRQAVLPEPFVELIDDEDASEDEDTADEADIPVIGFSLEKLLGCQLQDISSTSTSGQV